MRKTMSFFLAAALLFCGGSAMVEESAPEGLRIRLTVGETVLYTTLQDNSASRSLIKQLPLTLSFEDYNGTEKIAYPPKELDVSDAADGCDPEIGTIAYYAPWGNLCIFYKDFRFSNGLVPLGKIEGDMEMLVARGDSFTMVLENE